MASYHCNIRYKGEFLFPSVNPALRHDMGFFLRGERFILSVLYFDYFVFYGVYVFCAYDRLYCFFILSMPFGEAGFKSAQS